MNLITINEFLEMFPEYRSDAQHGGLLVALSNAVCPKYGIDTKTKVEEFLKTAASRSRNFRIRVESITREAAKRKYENRVDLGNVEMGDGYLFRGRGYMLIKGRKDYTEYANFRGSELTKSLIEALSSTTSYAFDSACWVFAYTNCLLPKNKINHIKI